MKSPFKITDFYLCRNCTIDIDGNPIILGLVTSQLVVKEFPLAFPQLCAFGESVLNMNEPAEFEFSIRNKKGTPVVKTAFKLSPDGGSFFMFNIKGPIVFPESGEYTCYVKLPSEGGKVTEKEIRKLLLVPSPLPPEGSGFWESPKFKERLKNLIDEFSEKR